MWKVSDKDATIKITYSISNAGAGSFPGATTLRGTLSSSLPSHLRTKLLDYLSTHRNAKFRFHVSDMILNVHSDAS